MIDFARIRTLVLAATALLLAACGEEASPDWRPVAADDPARAELRRRADEARDELAGSLMQELVAALGEGGPARGIAVCRERAPAIAAETGRKRGLRIGRSSFKLRNPGNVAPAWAEAAIAERSESPRFYARGEEAFGALYPIRIAPPCLACHGAPEGLDGEVRAALAENYPEDRATGFAAGDLRGWFWVEID